MRGLMSRFDSMVHAIMPVLIDAAKKKGTVSFAVLYRTVDLTGDDERHECHRALEEAADLIRDFRIANYTCLMARKDSGLPGDGFFDMFRLHRNEEYINLVGNVWITDLTREQREKLTHAERVRVYADAK